MGKGFKRRFRLLDELRFGKDFLQDFLCKGLAVHLIGVAGDLALDLSYFFGPYIRRSLDRFQGFLDAFGLGGQGDLLASSCLACVGRFGFLVGRFFASYIHPVLNGFIFDSNIVAWNFHDYDHFHKLGECRSIPPAQAG